jgi:hypothetical protein
MSTELLKYESYLKMIKNSVKTKMFKNLYMEIDGKKIDITHNGILSCSYFVSNLLLIWGLIKEGHANVESTTRDMLESGWRKIGIEEIKPGDVIVWEKEKSKYNFEYCKSEHFHNGFYIGNQKAISNSEFKKMPVVHNRDYNGKRKIIAIYKCPLIK